MKLRISLSTWILLFVDTALTGYAVFALEYYLAD
jgi:hypothetical protein